MSKIKELVKLADKALKDDAKTADCWDFIAAANAQAIKEIAAEMEVKHNRIAELEAEIQRIREAVPKEIPTSVYKVIYDQCGGFVDCGADELAIWSACRAEFLRIIEGNKDE